MCLISGVTLLCFTLVLCCNFTAVDLDMDYYRADGVGIEFYKGEEHVN